MARSKKIAIKEDSEVRKFKMHPDLLFSVIQSQAGTVEKALLEAVMNAVDAGASKCNITVSENGYKVEDDGKGFSSRKEIDEFFETFGTPHVEGDVPYGRFRMGRGQLFAFSTTLWETSTFEMDVDIKKRGLEYILKENQKNKNGCTINGKWYEPLATQELFNMLKEFEKYIKYMQIPVYINDKLVSVNADGQKWDYKEEDFFVKVNRSSNVLTVYNMGALVANYSASRFGVGGIVVTRKALKVNFARNDVLVSLCPLWKKIDKKLKEIMGIEVAKKNILSSSEREALVNQLIGGEIFLCDVMSKGLISDISGKKLNFKSLMAMNKISFSTGDWKNKKIEERVNDNRACCILDESVLKKFDVIDGIGFVSVINDLIKRNNDHINELYPMDGSHRIAGYWEYRNKIIHTNFSPKIMDIMVLISKISSLSTFVEEKQLTKIQKAFVRSLEDINISIVRAVLSVQEKDNPEYIKSPWDFVYENKRKIVLGQSETALGWTDGETYIAFEIKTAGFNPLKIIQIMVHEYCHNVATLESHDHGVEFYELFHQVMVNSSSEIEYALLAFQRIYNKEMLKAGIKPKKVFDDNFILSIDNRNMVAALNEVA